MPEMCGGEYYVVRARKLHELMQSLDVQSAEFNAPI